jgi:hypothetical protein
MSYFLFVFLVRGIASDPQDSVLFCFGCNSVLQYLLKKGVQAGFISFSTVADGRHESMIVVFHDSIDGWDGGREERVFSDAKKNVG